MLVSQCHRRCQGIVPEPLSLVAGALLEANHVFMDLTHQSPSTRSLTQRQTLRSSTRGPLNFHQRHTKAALTLLLL